MISGLKPYTAYKQSGLPWAEQVPAHWDLVPNRGLVKRRKVLVGSNHADYRLLSLTKLGVIVRDVSTGKGKFSADMGTSQQVRVGDLVFCLFDVPETPRTVGLSRHEGMITGAYTVFESLGRGVPAFFELFYKAMDDRKLLSPLYSGLRNTIPKARFLGAKTPQPPLEEQAAIVRFLDWANGRLERAIRSKRKVIALLTEQKQTIILRAVTRGPDPTVPLKPSGVPWVGDIPQHWEVRALKRVVATKITDGPHETPELIDDGVDFMSAESMVNGQLVFEKRRGFISRELHEQYCVKCRPQRDDVFMCKSGATTGKVAIVDTDKEFSVWSPLALLRAKSDVMLPRFLFVSLQTSYVQQQVQERWSYGTQPNLSMGAMGRISIVVPTVPEQEQSLRLIEEESAPLKGAISRLEREVELLREYRIRLVADVVTGKLDVREAASRLTDEVEHDDVESLADQTDESDLAAEEAEV